MDFGRIGVWTWLDGMPAAQAAEFTQKIADLGYGTLWLPEAVGRDPLVLIAYLSAKTSKINFCTGIANIYARDAMSMRAIRETLGELAPGRVAIGMGVSHGHLVAGVRGHEYKKPVATMSAYIDAMEKAIYMAVKAEQPAPLVIAALRPKMLELAATKTSGAHPYFVPPEHTARAREILGKRALLLPEVKLMLETDAGKARAAARAAMAMYIRLPNYQNNLRWLGYTDADFENNGSDRLVDAIVGWGDEKAIAKRLQEHYDAGADHVCIQPLRSDGQMGADMRVLEILAPGRK
ncbi:MAG TPA: TIGR03620 family F420-dependent LLM class oxidoreductase [Myxococcota bacterium]|nr:TIGR03620 family F420-dependent LLM class oxidoreductase [Myxococcota bacterium]